MPVEDVEAVDHHLVSLKMVHMQEPQTRLESSVHGNKASCRNKLLQGGGASANESAELTASPPTDEVIPNIPISDISGRYREAQIEKDAAKRNMDQSINSFAGDCERLGHAGDITKREAEVGILPSHGTTLGSILSLFFLITSYLGISLDIPGVTEDGRPPIIQHLYV
jgi:hypothetical protein